MPNINSIYNAVFRPNYRRFNLNTDYFTVIVDTPAFAPLYHDVCDRLNSLIHKDSFRYFHAESDADLEPTVLDEKMSEVAELLDSQIQHEPPRRRYCVLTYFDDEHKDIDSMIRMLARLECQLNDVVTLVVTVSKTMKQQNAFLAQLAERVYARYPKIDLYLFSDGRTVFFRRCLVQSICGAIVIYSDIERYQDKRRKVSVVSTGVSQYMNQSLNEQGRETIKALPALTWSTMYIRNYDRRFDFICKYLQSLCSNLKRIDNEVFRGIQNEVYTSIVPAPKKADVKNALRHAVDAMPYVVSAIPKKAPYRLEDFLTLVFGAKGIPTLELTLKTTLAGIYRYNTESLVTKSCQELFRRCSSYAEEDLYQLVTRYLEQYIESLQASNKGLQKNMRNLLNEELDMDSVQEGVSNALDSYFEKFIQLYTAQKMENFWVEALRQLRTYPDAYTSYCKEACEYYRQVSELQEQASISGIFKFDDLVVEPLAAAEILALEENRDACAKIEAKYRALGDEHERLVVPDNCSPVFNIRLDANFYRPYELQHETSSYTMCGREYIGKYLVFIGGEEDV